MEQTVSDESTRDKSQGPYSGAGFCSACGTPLQPGVHFCANCGAPVAAAGTSEAGAALPPAPPASVAPKAPRVRKSFKLSRRVIILLSVVGALVVAGIVGAVVIANILKGGADSPEQAVTKSIEAMTNKDLVGLFTMVSPHERDAVVRVQDAIVKKAKAENIAENAKSVAPEDSGQGGSNLVFDGVDVTFSGVSPTVSQVSDDVAVVHLSSGEIKLHIDPAQTKGALRSLYDNTQNTSVTDQTWQISDLGPSRSGLSVLASKKDGRWYINLAGSVLEAVNAYQGTPRGTIPASAQGGSENPQTAAKSAVQASQSQVPSQIAPYLVSDEANLFYLYGQLWAKATSGSSFKFSFGNVDFSEGPHDGGRAQAYVNQISVVSGSSDRFTLTDKCFNNSTSSQSGTCLNGTAYQSGYGTGQINWASALLSNDGKFALTTVNEDGKWKVSLLDSLADHLVSAVNSLTHEQVLAVTGLARAESASGALTLGQSKDLSFNNAGYAVAALHVDKAMKLQLNKQSTLASAHLYSADGKKDFGQIYSGGYNTNQFDVGDYKVVAWAGSAFQEAARNDGKSAGVTASATVLEYVEPATINGNNSLTSTYVSSYSSSSQTYSLRVPSDKAGALMVKPSSGTSSGIKIVATVDGTPYEVNSSTGNATSIPVGVGTHTMTLSVRSTSSSSFSYGSAYLDISFANQ
ncbi:zinc-ribbon domain-containing protein [Pseudarthrobacter sp. NPDC058196]|uniref:zinc ribbon domain-containing protein n=1 Tax=Pseudarthrobacter sp. NPDC058196 TaxID=3346376 RepID=UPI0036D81C03